MVVLTVVVPVPANRSDKLLAVKGVKVTIGTRRRRG
jgi:hypothetical protein